MKHSFPLLATGLATVLLMLPTAGMAQPASPPPAAKTPDKDNLVVTARKPLTVTLPPTCLTARRPPDRDIPAPRVVSTYPAQGDVVRPGKLVLRITFDLPMACAGVFTDDRPLETPLADNHPLVVLTRDRRTFRIETVVEANKRYGLWLNKGSAREIVSLAGLPIAPFELRFSTSCGPLVRTTEESLIGDREGLREAEAAPGSTPTDPPRIAPAAAQAESCASADPSPDRLIQRVASAPQPAGPSQSSDKDELVITARKAPVVTSKSCSLNMVDELAVGMEGLKPILPGSIDGTPVKFILATGRGASWISSSAVRQFKLGTYGGGADGPNIATAHGEIYSVRGVRVPTVTMGPFRRDDGSYWVSDSATAVVDDLTVNNGEVPGEPAGDAAGWIGQDWFHTVDLPHDPLNLVDVEYDLAHGVIRFFQPRGCGKAGLAYWAPDGDYSVLSIEPRGAVPSLAKVNGADVRWVFATELGYSYMTLEGAARAGLKPGGPGVASAGMIGGVGAKPVQIWIGTVASLKIGDEEIRNTEIRFGDIGDGGALIPVNRPGLFLGSDFFLSHRILVSSSQYKIYFSHNPGPAFSTSGQVAGAANTVVLPP